MDLRRVAGEDDPRRAEVVEALGVADVLEADGEAADALHALTAGGVAGAAGQPDRRARPPYGSPPPPAASPARPGRWAACRRARARSAAAARPGRSRARRRACPS